MIRYSQTLVLFFVLIFAVSANTALAVVAPEPTFATFSVSVTPGSCSEIDLSCIPGDGSRRLIVAKADDPVNVLPVDGNGYTAGSLFGSGTNLGNNNFVVYNGTGSSTTITGLAGGSEYFFAVFEFNGTGTNSNYLTSGFPTDDAIAPGFTISLASTAGDFCTGDSVTLEVHGADTYHWSPSNGLSSTTDSVITAKPNNTITYTVEGSDMSGCTDSKSITLTVYQKPNVNLGNFSSRCDNSGLVSLTSGSPAGGHYSGDGVSGTQFNPSAAGAGQHSIIYSYTDIHGCGSADTSQINVLASPSVSFPSLADVCVSAPQFVLTGATPAGGTYSGTGVSAGQFSPSFAGVGNYNILYIYSASNGCSDSAISNQRVRALPNVSFSTLAPACLNATPFAITGGSPAGGTYSGNGVTNSQFSPLVTGAGTFTLTYSYTDSHNCSSSDTSSITVNTLPSVSLAALPTVCQNTGPVSLTGGSPAGGTFSGPGVGGTTFYSGIAGAGAHSIVYSYTNANGCTNSATQTLTVKAAPAPALGSDQILCPADVAHLNPGTFTGYLWSTGASTPTINVDTSGRGLGTFSFIVSVSGSNGCVNRDTVNLTFDICSGVNDISSGTDFIVYPNPSSSTYTIQSKTNCDVIIYDMKGSVIMSMQNVSSGTSFGNDLAPGTYLISVRVKDSYSHHLLMKN